MLDLTEIHNKLYDSTYCVVANTKQLYFLFFKDLIQKYLDDNAKNYYIYVSTTAELLTSYQSTWPNAQRIIYIVDGLIPTSIPININSIYIYHQQTKPTKEEQMNLIAYVNSHPAMKYIYVGSISHLLPSTRIMLFRYYLHFEIKAARWGRIANDGIYNHDKGRAMCRKYFAQNEKKKKVLNPIFVYDYFIFHDNMMNETTMIKFNQKKFVPKKKKVPVPTPASPSTTKPEETKVITKIKYIYATPNNPRHLLMPDGTKENYKELVSKYHDIIEV